MCCSDSRVTKTQQEVHIGCSGWFYWGWRGKFYPLASRPDAWFGHYAKHFRTVELNAPFYSWPKRSTVASWVRQAPRGFVYSIKVNRYITHDFRMEGTAMLVDQFYRDVGEPLAERMACFLFQFPPSFRYTKKRLAAICKQLDPRWRNVVEFRHKSWWNGEVYRAFRRRKITMCAVSAPRIPDKLVRTADDVYVRLHGTTRWYRHDYSDEELATWAEKIRTSGAKRAWIYFDNDRDAHAIKNAKTLMRMMKDMGGTPMLREEKRGRVTPASTSSARIRNPSRRSTGSARRSRLRLSGSRRVRSAATASAGRAGGRSRG
jgi:uncharacterized protein YecE (DUF72 family)